MENTTMKTQMKRDKPYLPQYLSPLVPKQNP